MAMQEYKSIEQTDLILTNPIQGRMYLKAAIEKGDEQDLLEVLHNIIDSFLDSEDVSDETLPLPSWDKVKVKVA